MIYISYVLSHLNSHIPGFMMNTKCSKNNYKNEYNKFSYLLKTSILLQVIMNMPTHFKVPFDERCMNISIPY